MIGLGDRVRCKHSGFEGVAVARTEFVNGCIQYMVLPRVKPDGEMPEEIGIDAGSLELVSRNTQMKLTGCAEAQEEENWGCVCKCDCPASDEDLDESTGGPMTKTARRNF